MVTVLAGGTGGAKLARGMADVVGADDLVVIANTGDDIEIYGVHVSPDPDLVTFWLADLIDERGWGLRDDTWHHMEQLEAAGEDVWFRLGDRDLELCRLRTEAGTQDAVTDAVGVRSRVLPMTADPVRTFVRTQKGWHAFQEFMIRERGADPLEVELRGVQRARPGAGVLDALEQADAIVIGPSNPVISIGPILAVPGISAAVAAASAPVVAVSPFVNGSVVKGPTEQFCAMAGLPLGTAALEQAYAGLIDGVVADERAESAPTLEIDVLMDSPESRERVARATLDFADALARAG